MSRSWLKMLKRSSEKDESDKTFNQAAPLDTPIRRTFLTVASVALIIFAAGRGWFWAFNAFCPYTCYDDVDWIGAIILSFLVGLPASTIADFIPIIMSFFGSPYQPVHGMSGSTIIYVLAIYMLMKAQK